MPVRTHAAATLLTLTDTCQRLARWFDLHADQFTLPWRILNLKNVHQEFAKALFEPLPRPHWVCLQPKRFTFTEPIPGEQTGQGGRRCGALSVTEELRLLHDLEARAEAGESISITEIQKAASSRADQPVSGRWAHRFLTRYGYVWVGPTTQEQRALRRAKVDRPPGDEGDHCERNEPLASHGSASTQAGTPGPQSPTSSISTTMGSGSAATSSSARSALEESFLPDRPRSLQSGRWRHLLSQAGHERSVVDIESSYMALPQVKADQALQTVIAVRAAQRAGHDHPDRLGIEQADHLAHIVELGKPGVELVWLIESLILAEMPIEKIATCCAMPESLLTWYRDLWFDWPTVSDPRIQLTMERIHGCDWLRATTRSTRTHWHHLALKGTSLHTFLALHHPPTQRQSQVAFITAAIQDLARMAHEVGIWEVLSGTLMDEVQNDIRPRSMAKTFALINRLGNQLTMDYQTLSTKSGSVGANTSSGSQDCVGANNHQEPPEAPRRESVIPSATKRTDLCHAAG